MSKIDDKILNHFDKNGGRKSEDKTAVFNNQ